MTATKTNDAPLPSENGGDGAELPETLKADDTPPVTQCPCGVPLTDAEIDEKAGLCGKCLWAAKGPEFEPAAPHKADAIIDPSEAIAEAVAEEHRLADAFRRVAAKNREVQEAQAEYDEAAEEAKTRKKRLESKQDELSKLIGSHADPAPMPLFDKPAVTAGAPSQAVASATTDDESWKPIPIREALLDLKPSLYGKLEDAQLWTMGEFQAFRKERDGTRWLTDIKGVGKAAVTQIEDAEMAFWDRWQARATAPAEQPATELSPEQAKVASEANAFKATPIPWAGFPCTVSTEAAKLLTIGDLQAYASDAGILITRALADLGINETGVAAIDAWLGEQLDKVAAEDDAAAPLREFLATSIPWNDFDESPADVSKLAAIADLENQSASVGLGTTEGGRLARRLPEPPRTQGGVMQETRPPWRWPDRSAEANAEADQGAAQ